MGKGRSIHGPGEPYNGPRTASWARAASAGQAMWLFPHGAGAPPELLRVPAKPEGRPSHLARSLNPECLPVTYTVTLSFAWLVTIYKVTA